MSADNVVEMEVWNSWWRREELLANRPRIRRPSGLPTYLKDELAAGRKYPYRLEGVLPGYDVRYRRGGWRTLETHIIREPEDEPEFESLPVRLRTTLAWIWRDDRPVAAVEFRELDGELVPDWCFWDAMDAESDDLMGWADMLLDLWAPTEHNLFAYGPILELHDVWVEARFPDPGIWKPVARELIRRMLPKCSSLFALAFPNEYGGRVPDGARTELAFERRKRAMMRMAEREFGLVPVPDVHGKEGYMWRPKPSVAAFLGTPTFNPNWRGQG